MSFGDDLAFLRQHVETLVLEDESGRRKLAVVPAWQGRIVTSTASGDAGTSFGWLNRELVAAREWRPHINAFGGEDRFWIGPEGGQFSVFFPPGADFDLEHWQTPSPIDSEPWELARADRRAATFTKRFELMNWSGTRFEIGVERETFLIQIVGTAEGVDSVAFASRNIVTNVGREPWREETGLLSIWIPGMFPATSRTTVVLPLERAALVNDAYFGKIPSDRLRVREDVLFFRADARQRGKIGVGRAGMKSVLGSWDAERGVLTLVRFSFERTAREYVNSLWKLHDDPYDGDVVNSYNDGPATPGSAQFGGFYELETSSAALALAPGESARHFHHTFHMQGDREALDATARKNLGASLDEIESAFERA